MSLLPWSVSSLTTFSPFPKFVLIVALMEEGNSTEAAAWQGEMHVTACFSDQRGVWARLPSFFQGGAGGGSPNTSIPRTSNRTKTKKRRGGPALVVYGQYSVRSV
ncbi:MAG: hypothetical protein AVDCRST_MAG56-6299 [uncultured Cytophagales bacterium]|uniref:Uncharacterized protein n=1 Tax=uncultured Cytophagales bacterium TaxID=158755 RepID=A0A6J4KQ85_9SPHI|nr:MAG: hypothetical protein AVDCRST_MAG56-6299 [uncultured Cytophagales bacterium]